MAHDELCSQREERKKRPGNPYSCLCRVNVILVTHVAYLVLVLVFVCPIHCRRNVLTASFKKRFNSLFQSRSLKCACAQYAQAVCDESIYNYVYCVELCVFGLRRQTFTRRSIVGCLTISIFCKRSKQHWKLSPFGQ